MNKVIFLYTLLIIINSSLFAQEIPIPYNYSIIDTVYGDLDKDQIRELVVAYNTAPDSNNFENIARSLIIYKLKNDKWTEWKYSEQALYGSMEGGMMGDPFGGMEINKGILFIDHTGGSSWKWGHTDKYRFQEGDFYLIGYSSISGKPCEYWKKVDFNISTGKMLVTKEFEKCEDDELEVSHIENETLFHKGLNITLQTRREKEIKIVTPKYNYEIYISSGID